MKTYMGRRDGHGEAIVEVLDGKGGRVALPPRLDLANHSPTGFDWGYGGSGPAQLALALLADALMGRPHADVKAKDYYQDFKFLVIARLPQDESWSITEEKVRELVRLLESRRGA